MSFSRRQFHCLAASSILAVTARGQESAASQIGPLETFVPTRAITRGPAQHWFGYYDKNEFDATNRFVLSNEVTFEGRSPTADDTIGVGFVDTQDNDKWTSLGTSAAWGWQQGCMLQWISQDRVLWNDRDGDRFVSRIYNGRDGSTRTLPRPIYTVSPDGTFGLSADFRRINNLRPGYGYSGLADPHVADRAPSDSGIWKVDFATGNDELILSLADVAKIAWPDGETHADAWHYFNHLLINPSGTRFIVLHRYRPKFDPATLKFEGQFVTRMLTADVDGGNLYVLDPSGNTSHFIWQDDQRVTMWTRPKDQRFGFYTLTDQTPMIVSVGADKMTVNGHNTYLPAPHSDWILNDTYPDKQTSRQTVFLYHVPTGRRVDLGHFPSPRAYRGEWRCDTHPRSNRDGTVVAVDSPHDGGRQVYLMDVSEIVAG